MKIKHHCLKCGTELTTENVSPGYEYVCPKCDEDMYGIEADERYFPDDPKNKVFAVDVYVTVCKCVKVEANSEAEADSKAQAYVADLFRYRTDAEYIRALADEGFHYAEELETRVSGEADEHGDIQYY